MLSSSSPRSWTILSSNFIFFLFTVIIPKCASFVPTNLHTIRIWQQQQLWRWRIVSRDIGIGRLINTYNIKQQHNINHNNNVRSRCKKNHGNSNTSLQMIRNIDLPECLIFYGIDSMLSPKTKYSLDETSSSSSRSSSTSSTYYDKDVVEDVDTSKQKEKEECLYYETKTGVVRLLEECASLDVPAILLSECRNMHQIKEILKKTRIRRDNDYSSSNNKKNKENKSISSFLDDGVLHYRSTLDMDYDQYVAIDREEGIRSSSSGSSDSHRIMEDEMDMPDYYNPHGQSPSPGAILDALHSITIQPRGFGGSSGFGVKAAEAMRFPLARHTVVFVSCCSDSDFNHHHSPVSVTRHRCIASRTAGCRVMFIEDFHLLHDDYDGTNNNTNNGVYIEDVADGIVDTLGTIKDWSMVTLDDISTPGNYWLNMATPRDEFGNRVDPEALAKQYQNERIKNALEVDDGKSIDNDDESKVVQEDTPDHMDEDEIASILADLDSI